MRDFIWGHGFGVAFSSIARHHDDATALSDPFAASYSLTSAAFLGAIPLAVPDTPPVEYAGPLSIIPSPGTPGIAPNITATVVTSGDLTVSSGTTYYADSFLPHDLPPSLGSYGGSVAVAEDSVTGTLTNNGVIWNELPSGGWVYGIMSAGRVVNSGKVVSQYDTDSLNGGSWAFGIMSVGGFARGTDAAVQNTGQIFAISADKQATGLYLNGLGAIVNSGVIAAQATGAYAYAFGVQLNNDGDLDNHAGGQILAEAHYATAVEYTVSLNSDGEGGGAATITNAGLIEAHSSDGENPSYGIHAEHGHENIFTIDNSGTITADYAIYFDTRTFQTAELSTEVVTNEATGVINGVIYLDLGDDQLVNKGAIHGIVAMGWGDDQVDNSAGTIDGYTDLDLGNDVYIGGAGEDDVLGGRDNDTISGGGGDDLILGGYGDDTIDGGSGNDGLFGEFGNDTITAGKGDYVSGGPGNDFIKLTDFGGFYAIDGDSGNDTLQLPSASRLLDLSGVVTAGTLTGIDDLSLGHNLGLVLRAGDVAAISDASAVTVQSDASNHVYLLGSWSEASQRTVSGVTYRVFDLSGSEVLIQTGTVVSVQASAPAGAAGFDAGSGVTPPFPNTAFLDTGVTQTDQFPLIYSLTIAADETWISDQFGLFRSADAAPLVNYGTLVWQSDLQAVGYTYIAYRGDVTNNGTLEAIATGNNTPATAVYYFESGTFANSGTISAYSQSAFATGVEVFADFTNTGTITAHSDSELQYTTVGVSVYNYGGESVTNSGLIQAIGNSAVGFQNTNSGGYFTNAGTIDAESPAWYYPSIAVAGLFLKITNTGSATADIFTDARGYVLNLENDGSIQGVVRGSEIADTVNNKGTISGEIDLFAGDDVFDGHAGHQNGAIYAGDGNDTVIGGTGAETIVGEGGDDSITGNGGNDSIDGGLGSDTAVFSGKRSDYRITIDSGQRVATVVDLRSGSPDGTDTVRDVQYFKFSDGTVASGIFDDSIPTGGVSVIVTSNGTAIEDHQISADTHLLADADGLGPLHYQWQHMDGGIFVPDGTWVNVGTDSSSYVPGDGDVGKPMRVIISYTDQHGTTEQVISSQTSPVVNINDPPTLSGIGAAATFTAQAGAIVIAPDITVTDPDDTILSMATVTISGGYLSGDVLDYAFSNNDIGGHYDPTTHVLTLNGGATLALYQAALRLVTFASSATDPSAGGSDPTRTITFVGYDQEGLASSPITATIDIVVPHVAPTLSNLGNVVAYVEQAQAVVVDAALLVSDDTGQLAGASVAISSGFTSGDILNLVNQNGITGSWNAATHVLTLSGSASVANYQAALRLITFSSTSDNPTSYGASTSRTVTWQVDDGQSTNHASNTGSSTINVTGVNDAPAISGTANTVGYTEQASAVALDGAVALTDPDSAALTGATVAISSGFTAGDILNFVNQNGITGSWNAATHVLTLSGSASLANYQAALRSVTFSSNSDNPTALSATRTVTWQVDDGQSANHASNTGTTTINVTGVNDAPVISGAGNTIGYTEQASAVALDGAIALTDPDSATLTGASVTISSGYTAGDVLNFINQSGITGSYNAATHVLTLSGSASLANYQAALRSVTYSSTSDNPTASSATRTVTWQVDDGQSANHTSNTGTTTINVTGVNDAPVISGAGNTIGYTEQASAVTLDGAIALTDPDSAALTGATVTISTGFTAGDTLNFVNQNGISGSWNAATHVLTLSGSASLANYQAALRSVTYSSTSDNPTASSVSRTVTWQVDDGQSANHASNTGTTTINVTAVNDAPVISGTGNTVGYTEQASAIAIDGAIVLADADGTTLTGASVSISSGYTAGDALNFTNQNGITGSWNAATHVLTLSGSASLASYQAALRSVTFSSTSDNPTVSSTTRTVSWLVDDGQLANHASNTGTSTISVTPVNDAPVLGGAGNVVSYTEQASGVVLDSGLTLSDLDSASLSGATVKIAGGFVAGDVLHFTNQNGIAGSWNAATHILTLTGASSVANYQAALRSITFSSPSDNPTDYGASTTRTVTWQVDDGQAANHASNTGTTTVTVTAVDDPASLHDDAFTITAAYPAGAGLSIFADNGSGADSDPDTLLAVTAVNGVTGNVGHQITLSSGALLTVNADGSFVYDPNHIFDYLAAPGSGASDTQATDSFTYTVNGVVETATVTILGADDNDTLYGTSGNDNFYGGDGTDTLVLTGARSDYGVSFDRATATYTLIDLRPGSPDGTDTLHGIEKVQFTSGTTSEFSVFTESTTDSGMVTRTTYDAANDHPWLSVAQTTDTQSSLMSQTIVTDQGTKWVNQYDSTGTQSWLWTSSSFDAAGHQLTETGTNDDGSHWLTLFDAAGAYSWANVTLTFDASWNQTGISGTNDDTSHTVSMSEVRAALDTVLWYTTPYDADVNGPATSWNFSGSSGDDILFGFAGDDRLIGVAGNNYFDGGTGNDYLMGGPGTDRFVFHYGDGLDTVAFFHTGTDSADVIELHNYGISSFAQLQPYLTQVGGDVVIAFDDANHITLQGMQVADLNASEFVFA
ncbi:MAG: hypothetical protein JSR60_20745 [Proteobacteria bacterium]|nr:hypothetical protein [Pseudomonadota bacterium]